MIYLDYAATSFKKPPIVHQKMGQAMRCYSANPGRGGHDYSIRAGEMVFDAREKVSALFGIKKPEQLAFFQNTTAALNAGIKGVLSRGDHVVVSSMEHNSVMRPLEHLKQQGIIRYSVVQADANGRLSPADFKKAMQKDTKLVICTHASNVCGNVYDIAEIGRLVRGENTLFMVDAAQSAGVLPIDIDFVDLLAFPGHKSLYGPQGTGGLYLRDGITCKTIIEGGTGSQSELLLQPETMPDRLESGTLNVPAICGLGAAAEFVMREGINTIFEHEHALLEKFRETIKNMPEITIYGDDSSVNVLALNVNNMDSIEVAEKLNKDFGIAVRSGLHCAPAAHQSLNTLESGTVRFSFGYFTTQKEVDAAINALYHIVKETV